MQNRLRLVSIPNFRLVRGERILPLVLAVSVNPSDNVYDYVYDGENPTASQAFVQDYIEGSDPYETQYVLYVDGGDPFTELPS